MITGVQSIEGWNERHILQHVATSNLHISMLDMRNDALKALRDKGFVRCGQEMVDCTAVNMGGMPAEGYIISGKPTLNAWVIITETGREAALMDAFAKPPTQIAYDGVPTIEGFTTKPVGPWKET